MTKRIKGYKSVANWLPTTSTLLKGPTLADHFIFSGAQALIPPEYRNNNTIIMTIHNFLDIVGGQAAQEPS
jgi:hypothetical protein